MDMKDKIIEGLRRIEDSKVVVTLKTMSTARLLVTVGVSAAVVVGAGVGVKCYVDYNQDKNETAVAESKTQQNTKDKSKKTEESKKAEETKKAEDEKTEEEESTGEDTKVTKNEDGDYVDDEGYVVSSNGGKAKVTVHYNPATEERKGTEVTSSPSSGSQSNNSVSTPSTPSTPAPEPEPAPEPAPSYSSGYDSGMTTKARNLIYKAGANNINNYPYNNDFSAIASSYMNGSISQSSCQSQLGNLNWNGHDISQHTITVGSVSGISPNAFESTNSIIDSLLPSGLQTIMTCNNVMVNVYGDGDGNYTIKMVGMRGATVAR